MSKRVLVAVLALGGLVTVAAGVVGFLLLTPTLSDIHQLLAPALGLALLAGLGTAGLGLLVVLKALNDEAQAGRRRYELSRKHFRWARDREEVVREQLELARAADEALEELGERVAQVVDQEDGLAGEVNDVAAKLDEVLHDQRVNARTATEQIHDLVAELRAARRSGGPSAPHVGPDAS